MVTGMANYAAALEVAAAAPYRGGRDRYVEARLKARKALAEALRHGEVTQRPSPKSLKGIKEWLIAVAAARTEQPPNWRVNALLVLLNLAADAEKRPRTYRGDKESVAYEAKLGLTKLFASELLSTTGAELVPLLEALDAYLDDAPELSSMTLEEALLASDRGGFAHADALWRLWDVAMKKVFADDALRKEDRWYSSRHEKNLTVLLFCSVPWKEGIYDFSLLKSRPRFISDALEAVGDTSRGLKYLLRLGAGVGRAKAVPASLPALRDAFSRAPADVLTDFNSLWHAETICRVAVHEHREALLKDVRLRLATLDILDRLVDAGSSLAFQLRDYLATSPSDAKESVVHG